MVRSHWKWPWNFTVEWSKVFAVYTSIVLDSRYQYLHNSDNIFFLSHNKVTLCLRTSLPPIVITSWQMLTTLRSKAPHRRALRYVTIVQYYHYNIVALDVASCDLLWRYASCSIYPDTLLHSVTKDSSVHACLAILLTSLRRT